MSRRLFFASILAFVSIGVGSFLYSTAAAADSLSISPLQYKSTLAIGESKKGFVDVVNPDAKEVEVKLKVQAFRQSDDQGGLQFYDDAAISKGVKLDLTDVLLKPHEGIRIYFLLDGPLLPNGDVFAAIFASTVPVDSTVVSVPTAQVGTLLLLQNGNTPPHHATIKNLNANWLQVSDAITLEMNISNTDPIDGVAIGFIPEITFLLKPHGGKKVDGPLLFAGRTRTVDYRQKGDYFGPVLVQATVGDHTEKKLIFAITGYWRWLTPVILMFLVAFTIFLRFFLKKT